MIWVGKGKSPRATAFADKLGVLNGMGKADEMERMIQDIQNYSTSLDKPTKRKTQKTDARYRALCDQLTDRLQTKVQVNASGKCSHLVIDFYSDEDLTRILDALGVELY